MFLRLFLITMFLMASPLYAEEKNCVILISDVARPHASLDYAARHFLNADYKVTIVRFPENHKDINYTLIGLANGILAPAVEQDCPSYMPEVNFVAFGLGTAVLNQYLFDHDVLNMGKVVLFEPPVQNKNMVESVHSTHPLYKEYIKNFRSSLEPRLKVNITRDMDVPIGVIGASERLQNKYGKKSIENRIKKRDFFVPGMYDETYIIGQPDFIMQNNEALIRATTFLANGAFDSDEDQ